MNFSLLRLSIYAVVRFQPFFGIQHFSGFQVLSWQNCLLCMVRELSEGGSAAVAVGVCDRSKVTHDT